MLQYFPTTDYAEDLNYSQEMLYLHGILKGSQVGPLLGLAIGIPSALYFKNTKIIQKAVSRSLLIGPLVVSGMIFNKMKNQEFIGFQDRAWRLQRNLNQNKVDDYTIAMGLVGTGVALATPGLSLLAGFGIGSIARLGIFATVRKISAASSRD